MIFSGENAVKVLKILSESKQPHADIAKMKNNKTDDFTDDLIQITPDEFCRLFGTKRSCDIFL